MDSYVNSGIQVESINFTLEDNANRTLVLSSKKPRFDLVCGAKTPGFSISIVMSLKIRFPEGMILSATVSTTTLL